MPQCFSDEVNTLEKQQLFLHSQTNLSDIMPGIPQNKLIFISLLFNTLQFCFTNPPESNTENNNGMVLLMYCLFKKLSSYKALFLYSGHKQTLTHPMKEKLFTHIGTTLESYQEYQR